MADSPERAQDEPVRVPLDAGLDLTSLDPATLMGSSQEALLDEEPLPEERLWAIIDDEGDDEVPERPEFRSRVDEQPKPSAGRSILFALFVIALMAGAIWLGARLGW
ncbi:MAG: hypothetical protein U0136_12255 [Bdellovibrionota bacterium]